MERIQGISFYQDLIKYITIEIHNNKEWNLTNYGEILMSVGTDSFDEKQRFEQCFKDLNKKRFKKYKGFITHEADCTYINMKKISTLNKINYADVIKYNFQSTLPRLFEKDQYKLEYTIHCNEKSKATEIVFMGTAQKRINEIQDLNKKLGIKAKSIKPSYQYFVELLRSFPTLRSSTDYGLYVESSNQHLTLVLFHHTTPVLKRSIEIDENLTIAIQNFFHYLKHYLMIADISLFIGNIKEKIEFTLLVIYKEYYNGFYQEVPELLQAFPYFKDLNSQTIKEFQDCFLATGSLILKQ